MLQRRNPGGGHKSFNQLSTLPSCKPSLHVAPNRLPISPALLRSRAPLSFKQRTRTIVDHPTRNRVDLIRQPRLARLTNAPRSNPNESGTLKMPTRTRFGSVTTLIV